MIPATGKECKVKIELSGAKRSAKRSKGLEQTSAHRASAWRRQLRDSQ
jgi:hypothetical protein